MAYLKTILLGIVVAMATPAMAANTGPIGAKGIMAQSAVGCFAIENEQKLFALGKAKQLLADFWRQKC